MTSEKMSMFGGGEESERKRELLLSEKWVGAFESNADMREREQAVIQADIQYTRLTSILNH